MMFLLAALPVAAGFAKLGLKAREQKAWEKEVPTLILARQVSEFLDKNIPNVAEHTPLVDFPVQGLGVLKLYPNEIYELGKNKEHDVEILAAGLARAK